MEAPSRRTGLEICHAGFVFGNIFACILLFGLSCHKQPHLIQRSDSMTMQTYDERAHGSEITVRPGERFEVRLKETPTTGFRWQLNSDGSPICALVSNSFEAPHENIPGRPGRRIFVFRAEHGGRAMIEFTSRRSWEKEASGSALFRLTITAP